jgi:tetratricopeptide (TPR) repeat protein
MKPIRFFHLDYSVERKPLRLWGISSDMQTGQTRQMKRNSKNVRDRHGLARYAAGLALLAAASAGLACGELANRYGPYDYRTDKDKLQVVHEYHFSADVEFLRSGMNAANVGGELDYVLRAFPNHHRALRAMDMLGRKEKNEHTRGANWRVECYFDRAIRFRKDDAMVRMLYGIYLIARDRKKDGITQLRTAEKLGASGANFHYNLGLAYFDLGDHEVALEHAKKAYGLGFPLPGLKDKLKRAGKWR